MISRSYALISMGSVHNIFSPIAIIMNYYCCISFFKAACMRKIWTVIISIRYSISILITICIILLCRGSSQRRRRRGGGGGRLCSISSLRTINCTIEGSKTARILTQKADFNGIPIRCTTKCIYYKGITCRSTSRSTIRNLIYCSEQDKTSSSPLPLLNLPVWILPLYNVCRSLLSLI